VDLRRQLFESALELTLAVLRVHGDGQVGAMGQSFPNVDNIRHRELNLRALEFGSFCILAVQLRSWPDTGAWIE